MSVYVITVHDDRRVREQEVYDDLGTAWARYVALNEERRGRGEHVCLASRAVLSEPPPLPNPEEEERAHAVGRGGRWA